MSPTARATLRCSCLSSCSTRERLGPSPTSTTPGRPTTRCTKSWLRVNATAGEKVHAPRSDCSTADAAPGRPSMAVKAAEEDLRPNTTARAATADSTPRPVHSRVASSSTPTTTNTTSTCLLYTSDAADDLLCVDLGG